MDRNAEKIAFIIDYIENHLEEEISLDELANAVGYSKYHLHRMFTGLVGFPVNNYIKRRKITEAAKKLLFTDDTIIDIAFGAGYKSQQAFTLAFKELYKMTPQIFRKKGELHPVQLKFDLGENPSGLCGGRIIYIEMVESEAICLLGYMGNTRKGFFVIPGLWHKLHRIKDRLPNRICMDYLVGLNDYSKNFSFEERQPSFDYYASVEVSVLKQIPNRMQAITLPAGKYAVFTFRGKSQDSLQPVVEYIYKVWFPQSTCQLNEQAQYDFARYGEQMDEKGQSNIAVWIPII